MMHSLIGDWPFAGGRMVMVGMGPIVGASGATASSCGRGRMSWPCAGCAKRVPATAAGMTIPSTSCRLNVIMFILSAWFGREYRQNRHDRTGLAFSAPDNRDNRYRFPCRQLCIILSALVYT